MSDLGKDPVGLSGGLVDHADREAREWRTHF